MTVSVKYPNLRENVLSSIESLSDLDYQKAQWGKVTAGVNYYDDLTLCVNILDDLVFPDPGSAVPNILCPNEVAGFIALESCLGELIERLGDSPDRTYMTDSKWTDVVKISATLLQTMRRNDAIGARYDNSI